NGQIIGAEALLRWQHPRQGMQTPAAFIQVLEEGALLPEVGSWVIDEACRIGAALIEDGLVDPAAFSLCINISPRQFRQNDFVERVVLALDKSGLPRQMVKLEITESIVIQHLDDTIAKMRRLRKLGIGFAMDDFGTGYSSL